MTTTLFPLLLADGMRGGDRPASSELLYHAVAGALAGQPRSARRREFLHVLRHAALLREPTTGEPYETCPNCHVQLSRKGATNGDR